MSYLVLARKWRPQTFPDITGQEHVTRTLTHAIEQDRVHHAFLFCGARGVGKTSAARVLAKALNCEGGPTPTPCGACNPCREIAAGNAIDVFEIDGASNRGIGEIRELREGVAYAPQRDRFKLYIIDEVHMLTTEAFNALLKTLEEPPPHVKFVFATTEPQKIPVTILSRCQRFDFKRIPLQIMVQRLREILEVEEVRIADGALRLVARESEGSMRDALSLLDRIISFCGTEADYDQVAGVLGVADRSWLRKLVEAALAGDAPTALGVVQEAFGYGVDLEQFASDLVHYLRDIIVLRVAGREGGLTDLADEEAEALSTLGAEHADEDLERLFRMATSTAERLSHAPFPRLELEMATLRMCRMKPLRPIDRVIDRIAAIERHLDSGAPLPPPQPEGSGGGGPRPHAEAAQGDSRLPSQARPQPEPAPTEPPRTDGGARPPGSEGTGAPHARSGSGANAVAVAQVAEPRPSLRVVESPPEPAPEAEPEPPEAEHAPAEQEPVADAAPEASKADGAPEPVADAAPEPPTPEDAPAVVSSPAVTAPPELSIAEEAPPAPAAEAGSSVDAEAEADTVTAPPEAHPPEATGTAAPSAPATFGHDEWEVFVDAVRGEDPSFAGTLDAGQVLGYADGVLRVAFQREGYTVAAAREQQDALKRLLLAHTGVERVEVQDLEEIEETPFKRREARRRAELEARRHAIAGHPKVQALVEQFDGELSEIHVYEDTGGDAEEETG